ncbi:MAG: hypothetical protein Q8L55_00330 [Phycisphaerales bacterium]|nr:hypothetical protein [Phycisphaerales bacterium]
MGKRRSGIGSFWRNVRDDLAESAKWFAWIVGTGAACGGLTGFLMSGIVLLVVGAVIGAVLGYILWWILTDNHVL